MTPRIDSTETPTETLAPSLIATMQALWPCMGEEARGHMMAHVDADKAWATDGHRLHCQWHLVGEFAYQVGAAFAPTDKRGRTFTRLPEARRPDFDMVWPDATKLTCLLTLNVHILRQLEASVRLTGLALRFDPSPTALGTPSASLIIPAVDTKPRKRSERPKTLAPTLVMPVPGLVAGGMLKRSYQLSLPYLLEAVDFIGWPETLAIDGTVDDNCAPCLMTRGHRAALVMPMCP